MRKFTSFFLLLWFTAALALLAACASSTNEMPAAVTPERAAPLTETASAEPPQTEAATPEIMAEDPAGGAAANNIAASIQLFIFRPKEMTVPAGTTVTWTNEDDIQHSVTSGTPENPDGRFDTDFFRLDESASVTFDEPGEYTFFCKRHNHMRGVVIVTEN